MPVFSSVGTVQRSECHFSVGKYLHEGLHLSLIHIFSGLGFESGGLAGAHAIHNGLTVLEECHHMYHGEKVAFGTITQLVLENEDSDTLGHIIGFCIELGLPVTLGQLGVMQITEEKIMKVAEAAAADSDTLHNMPFTVTAKDVYAAIMAADRLGRYFLGE